MHSLISRNIYRTCSGNLHLRNLKFAVERISTIPREENATKSNNNVKQTVTFKDDDTFGSISSKGELEKQDKWKRTIPKTKKREFVKKPKVNDVESDQFGSMATTRRSEPDEYENDEGDAFDEKRQAKKQPVLWKTPESYGRNMIQLIENKRLGDALLLYKKMIEVDDVKPNAYVYSVLIGGCGKYGFTSMAFQLLKSMKDRGLETNNSLWTSLFNSCGNCPFPEYGLKQAQYLYETLKEKGIEMNEKNYHAAIKAFGRNKDLQMAFRLVDEMIEKKVLVSTETFNFLLMGCASEKKSGFLQAILVWRKMKEKRIRPDIYSYNLLLRVTRDCGLGDVPLAEKLLFAAPSPESLQKTTEGNFLPLSRQSAVMSSLPISTQCLPQLPDIMSPNCQPGSVTGLIEPKTPQDRLALLGGMTGILDRMSQDRAKPELKTFTEFLELIPSDVIVEDDLLKMMSLANVAADIDFYNVLIKKRNWRADFQGAKKVLDLIAKDNLFPDIATFGTLALGCSTHEYGTSLLQDLKAAGFRPNINILGALVSRGCYRRDFQYVIHMLKVISAQHIKPDHKLIDTLEQCISKTKKFLVYKEKNGVRFAPDDPLITNFGTFLKFYKGWLKSNEFDKTDDPWSSYRIPKDETKEESKSS